MSTEINGNSPLQPRHQVFTQKELDAFVKDPGLFQNQKIENSQNDAEYNKLLEKYGLTPGNTSLSVSDGIEFTTPRTEENIADGAQGKNYAELASEFGSAAEEITVNNSDYQNFKNELLNGSRNNSPIEQPQTPKTAAPAQPAPVQNQPAPPQTGTTETQKDSADDINARFDALRAKKETDAAAFLDNEAKLEGSGNSAAKTDNLIKKSGIINQIKTQAEEIAQKNGISQKDAMQQIIKSRLGEVQNGILDALKGTEGAKNFDSKDILDISNLKVSCSKCGRNKDKHKDGSGQFTNIQNEGAREIYQIGHRDLHTERGDRKMDKLGQYNKTGRSYDSDPKLLAYFNQNETQRQLGIIHQLQEEMDKM